MDPKLMVVDPEPPTQPAAPPAALSPLRRHVLHNASKLSAASLVGHGASMLNAYAAAVLLGPMLFGVWQGARIVLQVGSTLHLGTAFGMNREVPILRGRGDEAGPGVLVSTTVTFTILAGFVAAAVLGALAVLLPLDEPGRWTLGSLAIMLPLQQLTVVFGMALSARQEFTKVSRIALLGAGATVVAIGMAVVAGFPGFLAGRVLASLVVAGASVLAWAEPLPLRVHRPALTNLVRIGLPMLAISLATSILVSADRVVVLGAFDASALGLYALGAVLFTPVSVVLAAMKSVMSPLFGTRYGATGDPLALRRLVLGPIEALAFPLAFTVGLIYLAAPVVVPAVLPSYVPGLEAARIVLWAFFIFSLTGNVANFFLTVNQQTKYLALLLGGLALNLAASWTMASAGYGLAGVALVQLPVNAAFFAVALTLALSSSGGARTVEARGFAAALLPALAVMPAVYLLDALLPMGVLSPWLATAAKMGLLAVGCAPLLWRQARPVLAETLPAVAARFRGLAVPVPWMAPLVGPRSAARTSARREAFLDAWLGIALALTTASAVTLTEFPSWMGGALNVGVVLLGLWMIAALPRLRRPGLTWNPITPVIAAFWGLSAALLIAGTFVALDQGILSNHVAHTIPAYAFTSAAMMLITMLPDPEARLRRIAPWVIAASTLPLLVLLVLNPPASGPPAGVIGMVPLMRFHGWAMNPNQLAILLAMAPFLAAHLFAQSSGLRRWWFGGLLAAAVVVGAFTRSEALLAGWALGLASACAVVGWTRFERRFRPSRRQRAAVLAGAAVVAVAGLAAALPWLEAHGSGVVNPGPSTGPGHLEGRGVLWRNGLDAWGRSPLVGLGPGTYSGDEPLSEFGAHNTFIDWGTQTGLLGVIVLVVLLAGVLWTALRAANAPLSGGLVALIFLAMFHFVLKHPVVWYDLMVVLAFCGPLAWPRLAPWARREEVPAPVRD